MAEQAKKYRSFTGILYPDSEAYVCAEKLDLVKACFDEWACVLHDRDLLDNGEIKKPHIHWVGKRKNPITVKTVSNWLGLRETEIEFVKHGWKAAVQYLIHKNDPDKAAYDPEEVSGNFDFMRCLMDEVSSEDMARSIFKYLCETECVSPIQLTRWAIDNGNWSELRRAFPLWSAIMAESKVEYELKKRESDSKGIERKEN